MEIMTHIKMAFIKDEAFSGILPIILVLKLILKMFPI